MELISGTNIFDLHLVRSVVFCQMIFGGGTPLFPSDITNSTESATILAKAIAESSRPHITQKFYWVASGIGALVGFAFGGKMLSDLSLSNLRLLWKQRILKRRYPIGRFDKEYFIWGVSGKNPWWLIDLKRKTRHHVLPYRTVEIMGWEGKRKDVPEEELNQYTEAEKIDASKI